MGKHQLNLENHHSGLLFGCLQIVVEVIICITTSETAEVTATSIIESYKG